MKFEDGSVLEQENKRNLSTNELDNALVVMHNELARKQTRWNVRETKLFYSALSKIRWRDENNWINLKKKDVVEILEIDKRNTNKLRKMFEGVLKKSYIKFGKDDDTWSDGFLLTDVKSNRNEISIKFNDTYLPLLDQLTNNFTMFQLKNVAHFKSKYSIILYQFLKSWFNPKALVNIRTITLKEAKKMFELADGEYVRKGGSRNGIFDTTNFKVKTLDRAMKEINGEEEKSKSKMVIEEINTLKFRGMVAGYEIKFSMLNEDGTRIWNIDDNLCFQYS